MNYDIRLKSVRSLTSGMDLLPDTADSLVEVSEFGANDITCDLPKVRVAAGQLVSLNGRLILADREHEFDATGKIESSQVLEDGSVRVHIVLRQFDKDLWAKFQDGLRARQERISRLLMSMKGESE